MHYSPIFSAKYCFPVEFRSDKIKLQQVYNKSFPRNWQYIAFSSVKFFSHLLYKFTYFFILIFNHFYLKQN